MTYEAELMPFTGVEGTDGEVSSNPPPTHRYFWQDSSIYEPHTFIVAGAARIRVTAMGEILNGVGPHMVVKIDGSPIGDTYVNETSYTQKTFDFTATTGSHEVRITYDNDAWVSPGGPGNDRNLLVDKVEVLCGGSDAGAGDGGGSCSPQTCTSASACVVAQCTANGCQQTPAAAGTSCSDGNACNGDETCDGAGNCVAGTPSSCSSGNPCIVDGCDPASGCTHTPAGAGASCSDGNACNGVETCDGAGTCAAGSPPSIDDGNPCTADACDPVQGVTHTPVAAGTSCETDNDVCNGIAQCDGAGNCAPGTPPTVDDGDVCTIDTCDPISGVSHQPIATCDSTPVQRDEAPFETRASLIGKLATSTGGAITSATFTVYDDRATGAPRSDVAASIAADGSFRLRLQSFAQAQGDRTPPQRLVVVIDSPGTLRGFRVGFAHPGEAVDLGTIVLIGRDPQITNIGPDGGTATDSRGLVTVQIPAGALTTTVPVQITPLTTRAEFPAPLPDSTITMYGVDLQPTGTTFAAPATIRLSNYRNLPTTLTLPIGYYDEVENRWDHIGQAVWDGSTFSGPISHFSDIDANGAQAGDLVLIVTNGLNRNKGSSVCNTGSSWRPTGGSVADTFPLPSTHAAGQDFGLSLNYDSGLAGSRRIGASPTDLGAVPHGTLGVAMTASARTECVPRGGSGPASLRPGECASFVGSCGTGGGAMTFDVGALGTTLHQERNTASNAIEGTSGGYLDVPLTDNGGVTESGFVTSSLAVGVGAASQCAANGGTFGVADAFAARVQLPAEDAGPYVKAQRRVFFHHRFASPYGAGWGITEISRVYRDSDTAVVVGGDGREEYFRPRVHATQMPNVYGEQAFARDFQTGEIFAASGDGSISRVDPLTGAFTAVLSGLAFGETMHGLAVAYVGGVRHFGVAMRTRLVDVDSSGALRTLATRGLSGNYDTIFNAASVAASGSTLVYTDGDDTNPIVYRVRLDAPSPTLEPLSVLDGDRRLAPRSALSAVVFDAPRGLADAPDGSVYLADPRRNAVYHLRPDASGMVGPNSAVDLAVGDGRGTYVLPAGERLPAETYPLHTPQRVSLSEDGYLLINTGYGIVRFDPSAKEAELLFLDGGRDEMVSTLSQGIGVPALVAISGTAMFARTSDLYARIRLEMLSSEDDPTRTLALLSGGEIELTDTMRAVVQHFDASGRLVQQRKRTGETEFTVTYTDASSDRIDHVTDAAGRSWVFTYSGGKLASITDPAGGVTQATVDDRGDLASFTTPDGQAHAFAYDQHHVTSKTSPAGDVTNYTYAPDGTVATSTKPAGETHTFVTVDGDTPTYGADGKIIHAGSYTDGRGVVHSLVVNALGGIEKDTYTADGTTYTRATTYFGDLFGNDEAPVARRKNVLYRPYTTTLNDVVLAPPMHTYDSFGRPLWQNRQFGSSSDYIELVTYDANGWLATQQTANAQAVVVFERDAQGHVLHEVLHEVYAGGTPLRQVDFTWRADGQPATITAHGITTTLAYDDAGGTGNLLSATDTTGASVTFGYDARGNVTSLSDGTASGAFVFDAGNRLLEAHDGFGQVTTFRYTRTSCGCSESDLVTAIHTPDLPAGVDWLFDYGAEGRVSTVTDPDGFTETYTYEPTGEVKSIKDRNERTTTMGHDQLGRLLSIVDTLGRKHQRTFTVPSAGAWSGPTLTAGSADATAATTSLSTTLRSGDYQLGLNAYPTEGYPARISLYRDATFELAYDRAFDNAGRPLTRTERQGYPIDSTTPLPGGTTPLEYYNWDPHTSQPLLSLFVTAASGDLDVYRNNEADVTSTRGVSTVVSDPIQHTYTRDTAGRVTQLHRYWGQGGTPPDQDSTYTYRPDGRLDQLVDADGTHNFTYDARGFVATQVIAGEGTYTYAYDEVGRNTRIEFPDGHVRHQVYDDLGRVTSRCYEYPADASLNRCYGAQYDAVGNPLRLSDPEGADVVEYDALDRVKNVSRDVDGVIVATEAYDYNALGALKVNAGVTLDHQRPRLDGAGNADAAVPATLGGEAVTLDSLGRITSLRGVGFSWSSAGYVTGATPPAPAQPLTYQVDDSLNRWFEQQGTAKRFFVYEGANRVATFDESGALAESVLFAGLDHPLRLKTPTATIYFELDLAGNVRRLRGPNGTDLGGYRYTAFGKTLEDTSSVAQPLRWKARPLVVLGGVETYDMRARQWIPELGAFLSIDEFEFQSRRTTLWGWPGQNPIRLRDSFGRGNEDNPILVALAGALTVLGMGAFTPSDTSSAPGDVLGMASSVPGLGATLVYGLRELAPILERLAPDVVEAFTRARAPKAIPEPTTCPAERTSLPSTTPETKLHGPYTHMVNHGDAALDAIVREGQMIRSPGNYGDVAVRAQASELIPLRAGASKPVIEFYTYEAPHNFNAGNGYVWWYGQNGSRMDIVLSRIAHTDGSLTIFP